MDLSALNTTADLNFALTVSPNIIIIEQDMNVSGIIQLAPVQNGSSISLIVPLLLMGPPYPTTQLGVPPPSNVSLDLAGCMGCISLSNSDSHVYLINLHLTGLEHSASSYGDVDGSGTSLPLWAFQFDRSSVNVSVTLRNVTLTLPHEEYHLLLAGTVVGSMPGGGWKLKAGYIGWAGSRSPSPSPSSSSSSS